MARPKGSKNAHLTIDERIAALQKDIEDMTQSIKEKKAMIKQLEKSRAAEEKIEILRAIEESGKSMEEIMELLK